MVFFAFMLAFIDFFVFCFIFLFLFLVVSTLLAAIQIVLHSHMRYNYDDHADIIVDLLCAFFFSFSVYSLNHKYLKRPFLRQKTVLNSFFWLLLSRNVRKIKCTVIPLSYRHLNLHNAKSSQKNYKYVTYTIHYTYIKRHLRKRKRERTKKNILTSHFFCSWFIYFHSSDFRLIFLWMNIQFGYIFCEQIN